MSEKASRLKNFPISWFALIMGMSGFTIAWSRAEHVLGLGFTLDPILLPVTAGLFVLLTLIYVAKAVKYPKDVLGEMSHPVKVAFVPTFSISLLLLSIAFLYQDPSGLSFWHFSSPAGPIRFRWRRSPSPASSWPRRRALRVELRRPAWKRPGHRASTGSAPGTVRSTARASAAAPAGRAT